jgi:hypothetical protein
VPRALIAYRVGTPYIFLYFEIVRTFTNIKFTLDQAMKSERGEEGIEV